MKGRLGIFSEIKMLSLKLRRLMIDLITQKLYYDSQKS